MKPFSILICMLLLLSLVGCGFFPASSADEETTEPTTEATEPEDPYHGVRELAKIVTEADFPELENYYDLEKLDLSGSTCYTAIVVYAKNHPQVDVIYTVQMGEGWVDSQTEAVELNGSEADFELIMRNLVYLPNVKSLTLRNTVFTQEEIEAIQLANPELDVQFTVNLLGQELTTDVTEVNLSGLSEELVEQAIPALMMLPNLDYAELMDESGKCSLSKQDVQKLAQAAPGVKFHYVFQLFGETISTTDETVHFKKLNLTAADEPELRDALAIMAEGSTVILENCGLSNTQLDAIRSDYPNTDLVWRVYFGNDSRYSYLTNATTIRAVYNVTDDTCEPLRYCRSVKYMDIGHNETLSDLSFVGYMPDLEILIASGCLVSDLSGFENCKKLEFLELAYCAKLTDLTPLAGCEGLKNLNICYTKVSSLMPLDSLPLERLFCKQTHVTPAEQTTFKQIHEDCIATFIGKEAYAGPGWRYTDNGQTFTEIYKKVREVFNLDAVDKLIDAGLK